MTDRRAFLKLSFQSVVDAIKEVAVPLVEDHTDKIETLTQRLEGKAWAEVAGLREEEKLAQRFVGRHLLFLSRKATGELEAIDGKCPQCGSTLSLRKMDHTLLCLPCNIVERSASIQPDKQVFTRLPLKQAGEKWFAEVRKPHA